MSVTKSTFPHLNPGPQNQTTPNSVVDSRNVFIALGETISLNACAGDHKQRKAVPLVAKVCWGHSIAISSTYVRSEPTPGGFESWLFLFFACLLVCYLFKTGSQVD